MEARPKRLLLVEDDPIHAKLIRMWLRPLKPAPVVEWATNGEVAMEKLTEGPLPDLILLDLRLPRINGHEVLQRVKNDDRLKAVPVIMLTTSTLEEDRRKAYHQGATAFLVKPLDSRDVSGLLASVGGVLGIVA